MADQTLWGIHGGRTGDANTLFLKRNRIALGWREVGDLSALPPTREAVKAAVAQAYQYSAGSSLFHKLITGEDSR